MSLDEEIGRQLQAAHDAGELRGAPSYGKPLADDAAWESTPVGLRMGFRVLKRGGYVPPEVEMLRRRADLRARLAAEPSPNMQRALAQQLSELEQVIAMRLDGLRRAGEA